MTDTLTLPCQGELPAPTATPCTSWSGAPTPRFAVRTDLAHSLSIPIRLGDAALAEWAETAPAFAADADHTEIARYWEMWNGERTPVQSAGGVVDKAPR